MARRKVPARFSVTIDQEELSRLRRIEREHQLRPFLDSWASKILTLAAVTPKFDWPPMVALAYEHARRETPGLARIYEENL